MKWADEKADKIYTNAVLSNYSKIEVVAGQCRFNFKCHLNAIHEALEKKDDRIAMCMYIDENEQVIMHFLNYHKGKYIENTLGHHSRFNEYYFVKWIGKEDFDVIGNIFNSTVKDWRKKLPWYVRLFTKTRV